ncbi:hypothetical protein [Bifidobacterium pseudocatenulatum]|uniref:hypothetical protein n=1 Tax=Bifidobacterium pseudocatenulatum TaxID=28026 RepID=UPI00321C072B
MSNKVNGLWAVNSDGVFMFFNSVDSPSVWRFGMSDNVESWRMVPGVVNAQAVRGVAAAYRADGGCGLTLMGRIMLRPFVRSVTCLQSWNVAD